MKNPITLSNSYRILTVLIISLLFTFSSIAQKINYSDSWGKQGYSVTSENTSAVKLNYSINNFSISDQDINGKAMQIVTLPGQFLPNDEGAPNLPGSGQYIALPQGANAKLKIVSSRTEKFKNVNLAPAPRIPFDTEKGPLEYKKNQKIYSMDAFYPANPIKLSEQTQIRGVDVVMLGITPFQYNPITKELIVYRDIEVEITFEGGNGHFGEDRLRNRYWDPILRDALLNSATLPKLNYNYSSGNSRDEGFEYVIIVPDDNDFLAWADSLKMWRIKQGISTTVVTTTEIGGNTTTAIENYVDDIYTNWDPAPVAILLMADYGTSGNTIISPTLSHPYSGSFVSDNVYADVSGNHLPDIIFARMTAQNESHLEVMVTKMLNYEQNPPTSPDFYDHPITALGWQTSRWFQICSETIGGFFKNVFGKDPVRINAIYSGNPTYDPWSTATNTATVVNYFGPNGLGYIPATPAELGGWSGGNATDVNYAINSGAFLLQHRDHGGETGWGHPAYYNSDINGLTNTDLTFVFSINCLTGRYNMSGECFAEKFHRYTYNGVNSGALGIVAASEVSYSFVNDTYVWGMYDNMWPDFMPDYGTFPEPRGLLPAFGNAGGKYFLQQSNWPYNTGSKEITYNLFHHHGGAFSTMYSEVPQNLTVLHDAVLLTGLDSFTVTADEGSFIALTVGDEIIGTAEGTGAPVSISIDPQYPPTMVEITIFKTNYFRYSAIVQVIPQDGPYVVSDSFTFTDENENGQIDYNETIVLSLTMKNVGNENSESVDVTLFTTDEYITITDSTETYGIIAAGESVTVADGFSFDVAADIPDGHQVIFEVVASDGSKGIWNSTISISAHAPELEFIEFVIDDTASGNGNGKIDPGETADIIITVGNNGSSEAYEVSGELLTSDSYIIINSGALVFGDISPEENLSQTFNVTANATTPVGHLAEFDFNIFANFGISATGEFEIVIGQIPILVLDLDNNNSSGPQMSALIEEIGIQCDYFTTMPEDAQLYSTIFVCLGIFSNNYTLTSTQGAELAAFLDNGGNLYMEGGDTWYYDDETAVHPYFNINATSDGAGDISTIIGQAGTFTEGLNYLYPGENSYIDHIAPGNSSAMQIFKNQSPMYGNAVAYEEGSYKTIGASFEFGGLADGTSTKLELMTKYLEFFGFTELPEAPVQPTGLTEVCSSAQAVEYKTLPVPNADTYAWVISPGEAGTTYGNDTIGFVDWNPEFGGIATIKVCGVNMSGMGDFSEELEITVIAPPVANANSDTTICEDATYTLSGFAINQQSVLWTTAGDGTFDDATLLVATYTPGTNDISNGTVDLTLTAYAVLPCGTDVSDNMTLTILMLPTAIAGQDDLICENESYTLSGSAENYSAVLWTTAGDGTFDDPAILNATYTPGVIDIQNEDVVLTLTASNPPCTCDANDEMLLSFNIFISQVSTPDGPVSVDIFVSPVTEYSTQSQYADNFAWTINPPSAGIITGTDTIGTITWDPNFQGYAYIKITASNNCNSITSDSLEISVYNSIGITEGPEYDIQVNIVPNPNNGIFKIEINTSENLKLNYRIFNSTGKLVLEKHYISVNKTYNETINLSTFAEGIYYLFIETDKGVINRKIIVR